MATLYALVDCNNFYVSCERVFQPQYVGRPVVVLSNNDGCVISRSQEAKDLGIKMGQPAFQTIKFLEQQGGKVFSSNYELYGDMSRRVVNTLAQFTPNLEVYSIDESFLDLGNLLQVRNMQAYAEQIKKTTEEWTGIPVSVGVGPTKTLAKLANRLSKQTEYEGVLVLQDAFAIEEALRQTEVQDVWGIGRQHAKRLQQVGVNTAKDLRDLPDGWVKKHMAVTGLRTVRELRGEACYELELEAPPKQNICTSRSFGKPLTNLTDIQEALATHVVRCATKLRQQQSVAGALTIFLTTSRFAALDKQHYDSRTVSLSGATNSEPELLTQAMKLLKMIYRKGFRYNKTGIILSELMPASQVQLSLFQEKHQITHPKLMETLDDLRSKFGHSIVRYAVQGGPEDKSNWKMLSAHKSKCYTTKIDELLKVY